MTDRKHGTDRRDQFQAAEVEQEAAGHTGLSQQELDELIASSDTGARTPAGAVGTLIMAVALAWSLFQLWISSPLPFMLGFGVFNDTETRSFHLAFALFLAFAAYPATRTPVQLGLGVGVPLLLTILFIYGANEAGDANAIEALVSKLRHKLEEHGPRLIHTVRGVGYVLRSEPRRSRS